MRIRSDVETLLPGTIIEIKYLQTEAPGAMVEKWVRAQIREQDQDAWPMAELCDGQLTEIRPYMIWRRANPQA